MFTNWLPFHRRHCFGRASSAWLSRWLVCYSAWPSDSQAAREYADIIRGDFEDYIQDIQNYFRCLDGERARAFEEAREVSEDYGRFLQLVGD